MTATQGRPDPNETLHGGAALVWNGDLESGGGALRFALGAGGELPMFWSGSTAYGPGSPNPEELAAAAHAACFTMTLVDTLKRQHHPPRRITTEAKATFGVSEHVRLIRRSELRIVVDADGLDESDLSKAAGIAGRYCPVSNTLRIGGTELDVEARLSAG
jgi:lipoyl-dependent peroxiredoxin